MITRVSGSQAAILHSYVAGPPRVNSSGFGLIDSTILGREFSSEFENKAFSTMITRLSGTHSKLAASNAALHEPNRFLYTARLG